MYYLMDYTVYNIAVSADAAADPISEKILQRSPQVSSKCTHSVHILLYNILYIGIVNIKYKQPVESHQEMKR